MTNIKNKIVDFIAMIAMWLFIYLDDIIDTIVTCLVTVVVCLVLTNFIFMPIRVSGTSMQPTLLNGQLGFSNIIGKKLNGVDRFDIVIIEVDDEYIVKRVIGLPNEQITMISDNLYINDELVEQDFFDVEYVKEQIRLYNGVSSFTNDFYITLGDDEYFCLGDNRIVSQDSRYYGAFSLSDIKAKDVFVIFPFDQIGAK